MHYLICDLNIQKKGHYIGYDQYILNNISSIMIKNPGKKYSFLFNEEAQEYLTIPENLKESVFFMNDNCWVNTTQKGKIELFRKIVCKANELNTEHLIFMDLDQYQFPIFKNKFSFQLSGILFRPHHRIAITGDTISKRIASRLQRYKKILAEKFLIWKKQVSNIYILNDQEGVDYLNNFHGTKQFKFLVDPIFSYPSTTEKPKYQEEEFRFLIFGAINERKNITSIVNAYDKANFDLNTNLQIVGSTDEKYLSYLNELVGSLNSINPKKKISIHAGFVSNQEMDTFFAEADACLLIYKDFFGSSGLIGRAALHRKKVVGANVGLLNELIKKSNLGITCDPTSESAIKDALQQITKTTIEVHYFDEFFKQYSPEQFLETIAS